MKANRSYFILLRCMGIKRDIGCSSIIMIYFEDKENNLIGDQQRVKSLH